MTLTQSMMESLCASLASAASFHAPFPYFRAKNLFPEAVSKDLAALPFRAGVPASGRRETAEDRLYLNGAMQSEDALLKAVAQAFQSPGVARALGGLCDASLEGSFLRIEYTVDRNGFWLEPHTDLGVKKFTGLIALAGDDQADLGTDLYTSPGAHFSRAPFEPNAGIMFVPGAATWHGFAARPILGLRKSLIVNYVGADWQSREQLAFPDCPISF